MVKITIRDLQLFLEDLLSKRKEHLLQSPALAHYEKLFAKKLSSIQNLPSGLVRDLPLSEELSQTDTTHDNYLRALYYMGQGYRFLPSLSTELKEGIEEIIDTFIPTLSEIRESYADEASRAKERRPKLSEKENQLRQFPIAGGSSLFEVVKSALDAGEQLDDLLSERASLSAKQENQSRKEVAKLRSETLGLIGRCRSGLADTIEADDTLPANLDALIFGYLDELERLRSTADSSSASSTQDENA